MKRDQWCLTSAELSELLQQSGIVSSPASPLAALPPTGPTGPATAARASISDSHLERVVAWVADPVLELGLLRGPGQERGPDWFYRAAGGEDALVWYRLDDLDRHTFAWTNESELMAFARESLQLNVATPAGPWRAGLSTDAYQALLGAVDRVREHELQSLLARLPDPLVLIDPDGLCETLARCSATGDWRWLGALGQALAPFDFDLSEEACSRGLAELSHLGLLEPDGQAYRVTPTLGQLCARMGAPVGHCALHARFCTSSATARPQEHVAAIRALGGCWLLEVPPRLSDSLQVHLRDVTPEEIELSLLGYLQRWATAAASPATGPAVTASCPNPTCGRPLTSGARFCAWCGTSVGGSGTTGAEASAAKPLRVCPNPGCGRPLKPGVRFCTVCGTPVGEK